MLTNVENDSLTRLIVYCFIFQAERIVVPTILGIQYFATHSLFNFLLAAQPHPVDPETRMVLLHQVFVEAHHYAQEQTHRYTIYIK